MTIAKVFKKRATQVAKKTVEKAPKKRRKKLASWGLKRGEKGAPRLEDSKEPAKDHDLTTNSCKPTMKFLC